MLQTLRNKTSGWIATVILGLLIIPFAFFGVEQYFTGGAANYAAKIQAPPSWWKSAPSFWPVSMLWEEEEITVDEFRTRFEALRQQQSQAQGDEFDARGFESLDNKRKVLEQLIDERSLQLAAQRAGVAVSDTAVRDEIAKIPGFQVEGKFDPNTYQMSLGSMNPPRSPAQFEQLVRDSLLTSIAAAGIGESGFATKGETDRILKLMGETRDVAIAAISVPADTAEVTDAQIKAWYDGNAKDFRQPEQVTIEYVLVDGSQLPAPVVDEASLRKRYEEEKARFVSPEQRLVSHILIAVPADADAAAQAAAQKKAAALAEQAKAGADFAALAKANSDDTGSKAGGGDLGWIERNGAMVKPFEDGVFELAATGAVSAPVKSDFGWHVIKLRDLKASVGESFEAVRGELEQEAIVTERERVTNDLAGRLVDAVNQNPSTLEPAAKAVGLPLQVLGPFSRGSAMGVAQVPAVAREAFSTDLIESGQASDPIEIGPGQNVVIRVTKHTEEQPLPLAQAREQVIEAVRNDRAAQAASKAADELLAEVRKGGDLVTLAQAKQFMAQEVPDLPRGAPLPTVEANEAYFAAPHPTEGKPSAGKVDLGQGRLVVFAVKQVKQRDLKEMSPVERMQISQQLGQIDGMGAAETFTRALRKQFKVQVAEDRL